MPSRPSQPRLGRRALTATPVRPVGVVAAETDTLFRREMRPPTPSSTPARRPALRVVVAVVVPRKPVKVRTGTGRPAVTGDDIPPGAPPRLASALALVGPSPEVRGAPRPRGAPVRTSPVTGMAGRLVTPPLAPARRRTGPVTARPPETLTPPFVPSRQTADTAVAARTVAPVPGVSAFVAPAASDVAGPDEATALRPGSPFSHLYPALAIFAGKNAKTN